MQDLGDSETIPMLERSKLSIDVRSSLHKSDGDVHQSTVFSSQRRQEEILAIVMSIAPQSSPNAQPADPQGTQSPAPNQYTSTSKHTR